MLQLHGSETGVISNCQVFALAHQSKFALRLHLSHLHYATRLGTFKSLSNDRVNMWFSRQSIAVFESIYVHWKSLSGKHKHRS